MAKEKGARKAMELIVSGAFHSELMLDAQDGLAIALKDAPLKDSDIPFYSNVTGKAVKSAGEIRELLLKQLTSPVKWQDIIVNMVKDGFSNFLEVGPGKVLKGLVKRIDREAICDTCGTIEELESSGTL